MATKTKHAPKAAAPIEDMRQVSDAIAMADSIVRHDAQSVGANMNELQAVAIAIAKKGGSIAAAAVLDALRTHILETMPKRVA